MPNLNVSPFVKEGAFEGDNRRTANTTFGQCLAMNVTPVSLTNPTAATNLMTAVLPAFTFSAPQQSIDVYASGTYNLAAASTMVFTITLGGVTLTTITTASNANTSVTLGWKINYVIGCVSSGSAGTVESGGTLLYDGGATLAIAASAFNDINTAVSSAINMNIPATLAIQANLGTGNASSVVAERILRVVYFN